jgi:ribosomal protein S18 acetylase RimI-like enzyme
MRITVARNSHVPGIVEVWKELMDFHKDIDSRWSRSQNAHIDWEEFLREQMESEDALVLVALDKGRVVAYSISQISKYPPISRLDTFGHISDMAVTSEYRRQGIGERMLSRMYDWFESRNIDRIELSVAARNQVGYSFWKKQGFQDYMHRLYLNRTRPGKTPE